MFWILNNLLFNLNFSKNFFGLTPEYIYTFWHYDMWSSGADPFGGPAPPSPPKKNIGFSLEIFRKF